MNRVTNILTGLSLAVLFFVASAHAQFDEPRVVADIPFEFTVGTLSLPAGQYQFQRTESGFVAVRDASGRALFTLAGASLEDNGTPRKSTLKFVTVQGRQFLTQVWNEQAHSGYEFLYVPTSVEVTDTSYSLSGDSPHID
jgi:hypothetical protein